MMQTERGGESGRQLKALGWKRTLAYSLLPAVLLLGGLETAARVIEIWVPPRIVDYGLGFNPGSRLFVPDDSEPGMMRTNPQKPELTIFVPQRFAMPKPQKTFRIVALGGSSIQYLGNFHYLWTRMEPRLKEGMALEFINAGGSSYGSHRLVPWAAEMLGYEPDLVLLYTGNNEFEELHQLQLAQVERVWLQERIYQLAFFRFLRDRTAWFQIRQLQSAHNRQILARDNLDTPRSRPDIAQLPHGEIIERMEKFRANLATIITLCQANDVPVVIGTVPSNLIRPELYSGTGYEEYEPVRELFAAGAYIKGAQLARRVLQDIIHHQATDRENTAIRSLAKEFGIPLADVEAAIVEAEPHHVPGETLFHDHCHLNEEGKKIQMEVYERCFAEIMRLPN